MCEDCFVRGQGWKGWLPLPTGLTSFTPLDAWRDLSHPLGEKTPRASVFPKPRFGRVKSLPHDPLNVTEMQMVVHIGTHIDAPRHFLNDGPAFHDIPLDRLYGKGVVVDVKKQKEDVIDVADLMVVEDAIEPGDILVMNTGWHRLVGKDEYHDHPHLSVNAAQWLVEKKIKLVGFDIPTPDLPLDRRPKDFTWPTHHVLLKNGILICENMTNLDGLSGQKLEFSFMALCIDESDGAPVRATARQIQSIT